MRHFIELTCFMGFPQNQEKKFPGLAKGMQSVEVIVHKVDVDLDLIGILEEREGEPFRTVVIFKGQDGHINVMEDRDTIRNLMKKSYDNPSRDQYCLFTEPQESSNPA